VRPRRGSCHAVRIIEAAERIAGENDAYHRLLACLATLGLGGAVQLIVR